MSKTQYPVKGGAEKRYRRPEDPELLGINNFFSYYNTLRLLAWSRREI